MGRDPEITIIADNRELSSNVTKELSRLGCRLQMHQLPVGDYIISERICVERKTSSDFIGSVFNGRIFSQIRDMKDSFEKPVLLIEGKSLTTERNAHPNSIRGALASIAIDYSMPILWSDSPRETAAMLHWMAKREQEESTEPPIRGERSGMSFAERQRYLVAGLPGVNAKLSDRLLESLGSPEKVFNATDEGLEAVKGIGKERIRIFREILKTPYEKDI